MPGHYLPRRRTGAKLLLLALIYVLLGQLSTSLSTWGGNSALFWPAAGVALAALLLHGPGLWPGVFAGSLATCLLNGLPLQTSALIAMGAALALLSAHALVRTLRGQGNPLSDMRGMLALVLGTYSSALISAGFGTLALWLHDPRVPMGLTALSWWIGDSAGMAVVTPLILMWGLRARSTRGGARALESVLVLTLAGALGAFVFAGAASNPTGAYPLAFLPLPLIFYAIFRLGAVGALSASAIVLLTAIWATYHDLGPFGRHGQQESLALLQIYLGSLLTTTYVLLGFAQERERGRVALQAAGEELESRVAERTRELLAAKERLEREIAKRQQARDAERRLASILDATTDFVGMADREMRPFYINPAGRAMLDLGDADLADTTLADFHPRWAVEKLKRALPELEDNNVWRGELAFLARDGREIPSSHVFIVHRAGDGTVEYYSTIARDISQGKAVEKELRLAASVFEDGQEGIMITDPEGVILRVNRAFSEITGYAADEALGKTPTILRSARHDASFFASMWRSIEAAGVWQGEIWNRRRSGEEHPVWLTVTAVRDDAGAVSHYIGLFIDITQQKISEERIYQLAHYDPLTGLPNRRLFQEHLNQALSQAKRRGTSLGVLFVDLDHFKVVNDSMGHALGDALLKEAAERIVGCLRQSDVVGRWGGDEFVVLLHELQDTQAAAGVASKILDAFSHPVRLGDQEVFVGASVGISLAPTDADDAQVLLRNADAAMYRAKAKGRNNFQFFTEGMNADLLERLALETRLRSALAQSEFELHYQPQVDLHSGRIIGVEALLRWHHPELGMVPPYRFIPLAEETGLIVPIGRWVLEEACRQHVRWREAGLGRIRVAVNLSGRNFQDPTLADTVARTLEQTGMEARFLELELTETFLVASPEETVKTLDQLRALGTPVAIDDFGTGYSSLNYLKRFAIDRLKIDQSFVRDLPTDADDAAITATIIAMARNLGLSVTAEGVETLEQLEYLRQHGCDEIQGYYFSRPLPAADCTALLEAETQLRVS